MIILIYGGSGSGKSEFAEQQILRYAGTEQKYYIATMIPYGKEGIQRIMRHVALRQGKGFLTIECPVDIRKVLDRIDVPAKASILIECVSNLTANEMFENGLRAEEVAIKVTEDIRWLCSQVSNAVIVTNNIFDDGMEYSAETVSYAATLGAVNRDLASMADEVIEITAGIPCPGKAAKKDSKDGSTGMKLVIGGYAQGKLEYVTRTIKAAYMIIDETTLQFSEDGTSTVPVAKVVSFPAQDPDTDHEAPTLIEFVMTPPSIIIVNHLHLIIRKFGQRKSAESWIHNLIRTCAEKKQELIFISDEVGNGVIPMDAGERQFREDTGRILCDLAREADSVERVICGLPQILK